MLTDPILSLRETAFNHRLVQIPCRTLAEAQAFIAFACRCVRSTPLGAGLTPSDTLADQPILQRGLQLVERWEAGDHALAEQFDDLYEAVAAAATRAVGPFHVHVTGTAAACWSVVELAEAALVASEAGEDDATRLNDVAGHANTAAGLARHSGEALTAAALDYQEKLITSIWGPGH